MDMVMPMISMTLPIWGKKYNAAVEERQLMQRMYTEMKKDMENDLVSMYEMAYYDLEKMTQMIDLLDIQMLKSQQAIDLLLASYGNAGTDFEEILRLQQELYRYRMAKVTEQVNYQIALARLYYLTGKSID
jgi:outer membrane protein TolC